MFCGLKTTDAVFTVSDVPYKTHTFTYPAFISRRDVVVTDAFSSLVVLFHLDYAGNLHGSASVGGTQFDIVTLTFGM